MKKEFDGGISNLGKHHKWRCWMPMWVLKSLSRLCPMSRLCPTYVQLMTRLCPCPTYDQHLSSKSNFCQVFVLRVQSMSSIFHWVMLELVENMEDKTWTKIRLEYLPIYNLVILQLDKSWTSSGLKKVQTLSKCCPRTSCL